MIHCHTQRETFQRLQQSLRKFTALFLHRHGKMDHWWLDLVTRNDQQRWRSKQTVRSISKTIPPAHKRSLDPNGRLFLPSNQQMYASKAPSLVSANRSPAYFYDWFVLEYFSNSPWAQKYLAEIFCGFFYDDFKN